MSYIEPGHQLKFGADALPAIAFATAIDVLSAFIITFTIPYLLGSPGANLKAGVGWILGGDAVIALGFAIFFVPELKGRSLEEVDELFEARLWAWQFSSYETTGVGSRIARLEEHSAEPDKVSLSKPKYSQGI